jgi:ribose transport system substrate-binding protein
MVTVAAGAALATPNETAAPGTTRAAAPPKITIGYLQIQGASPAAIGMKNQLVRGAKALGWKVIAIDSQADPAKMASGAQSLVAQRVDAILTQALPASYITPALKKAKALGIPAIALGGPNVDPQHLYATTNAPSDVKMSQVVTAAMIKALGGKGKIVVQLYPPNLATARRDATMKAMVAKTNIKIVASHDIDLADPINDSRKSLTDMVQANPDAVAFWGDLDFEFSTGVQVLKGLGKSSVKVFNFYANPDSIAALRAGGSAYAVADSPVANGCWIALDQLLRHFAKKQPVAQLPIYANQMPVVLVNQQNVPKTADKYPWPDIGKFYSKRWTSMGFKVKPV